MTVDYYAEYAVFSWYNPFIYTQSTDIIAAFQSVYPEIKGIYEKIRFEGLSFETRHIGGNCSRTIGCYGKWSDLCNIYE